jgi:hypothetical protein
MKSMMMVPIVVTLVGIVTDVSDEQYPKAPLPNDRVRIRSNSNDTRSYKSNGS